MKLKKHLVDKGTIHKILFLKDGSCGYFEKRIRALIIPMNHGDWTGMIFPDMEKIQMGIILRRFLDQKKVNDWIESGLVNGFVFGRLW